MGWGGAPEVGARMQVIGECDAMAAASSAAFSLRLLYP